MLVGAALLAYPALSDYALRVHQQAVMGSQEDWATKAQLEELERAWEEARAYNRALGGEREDESAQGDLHEAYEQALNLLGDGVMAVVEIPSIDVKLPVYHGTSEDALAHGAGHVEGTALPIGQTGDHAVITAHRGLPSSQLFSRLNDVEVGDRFAIRVLNKTLNYEIDSISTVLPNDVSMLEPDPEQDLVTLVTCTPYMVNTHRLLVRGHRVEDGARETGANEARVDLLPPELAGVLLGLAILAVCYTTKRLIRGRDCDHPE